MELKTLLNEVEFSIIKPNRDMEIYKETKKRDKEEAAAKRAKRRQEEKEKKEGKFEILPKKVSPAVLRAKKEKSDTNLMRQSTDASKRRSGQQRTAALEKKERNVNCDVWS